jgi:hypothetical protein
MSNPNQYLIGYSPNDFFYINAQNNNIMPTDGSCTDLNINSPSWDASCNGTNFQDNSSNCVKKALCQNKSLVSTLNTYQSTNNGAEGKYLDSNSVFNTTILNTINLSAGILVLIYFIYKNRIPLS